MTPRLLKGLHPVCQPLSTRLDFFPMPAQPHQPVLAKEAGQIVKGCLRAGRPLSLRPVDTALSPVQVRPSLFHRETY